MNRGLRRRVNLFFSHLFVLDLRGSRPCSTDLGVNLWTFSTEGEGLGMGVIKPETGKSLGGG